MMPGRQYNSTGYRYGFNGKENDNEVKGNGNQQDYGMRIYDPRLGRFLSVDPIAREFAWNSPYAFAENDVIRSIDLEGLEKAVLFGGADLNSGGLSETMKSMQKNLQEYSDSKKLGYTIQAFNTKPEAGGPVMQVYNFIKDGYTKGEPIIIYGYSMGGVAAAQLSKLLKSDGIDVNLMVTIDPAFGYLAPVFGNNEIKIPDNVNTEVNIYQTEKSSLGSKGSVAVPQKGNDKTNILNIDYDAMKSGKGGDAHANMDEDTKDISEGMMKTEMLKTKKGEN